VGRTRATRSAIYYTQLRQFAVAVLDKACRIVYAALAMPNPPRTQDVTVESAPDTRRSEALQMLHIGRSRVQNLLAAARDGKMDFRGLFLARRGEQLVGAAWGQIVPGRSAFCWPAMLIPGEPEDTAGLLQLAVDEYLRSMRVAVVQAILPVRAAADAVRLVRAGYSHLADLDYLVSSASSFPRAEPQSDLRFQPFAPGDERRLEQLIERTYTGSLDCAELDESRAIRDVLTGYRETGEYRPDWWLVAQLAGEDVGCVLLADHPNHDQAELMYMGVVPERRGCGWGVQITRYAQWLVGQAPRQRMVLAVDDINWPAQEIYASSGFAHWDRRSVYVRNLQASG